MAAEVNWDSIGEDGFWAAEKAAASTARRYRGVEEDDIYSEALIYIATHPDEMAKARQVGAALPGIKGGAEGERNMMRMQLTRRTDEWAWRRLGAAEREGVAASLAKGDTPTIQRWGDRKAPAQFDGLAYAPALVEILLPVVFDDSLLAERPVIATAPPADMPKAASAKNKAGTHMAMYADIRRAWREADLSLKQRQALFLLYYMGLDERSAGEVLGVSHVATGKRADTGLRNLLAYLNGKDVALWLNEPERDEAA